MIFSFAMVACVFNFTESAVYNLKIHSIVHNTNSIVHLSSGYYILLGWKEVSDAISFI